MFPRRERLSRDVFPLVMKGRRLVSPHFSLVASKAAKGYAVVIPKKVARLSVTRHKMKRRVLAVLRTLSLPYSLIVFPKPAVASLTPTAMKEELLALLSKIR